MAGQLSACFSALVAALPCAQGSSRSAKSTRIHGRVACIWQMGTCLHGPAAAVLITDWRGVIHWLDRSFKCRVTARSAWFWELMI